MPTAYRPPLYPLLLTGCVALGDYSRLGIGLLHLALGVGTVGLVLRWVALGTGSPRCGAGRAAGGLRPHPAPLVHPSDDRDAGHVSGRRGAARLTWAGKPFGADVPSAATTARAALAGATLALGDSAGRRSCSGPSPPPSLLLHRRHNSRGLTAPGRVVEKPLRRLLAAGYLPAAFFLGAASCSVPGRSATNSSSAAPSSPPPTAATRCSWPTTPSSTSGSARAGGEACGKPTNSTPLGTAANRRTSWPPTGWPTPRRGRRSATEPGTFAYACLVRLGRFWSPLPHQIAADESLAGRLARWAVAVWYVAEFLLAAVF